MAAVNPFLALNRRTIRAATNPMDRCTVFSIFPREIDEVKHTIQPGRFIIPPGSYDKPSILVVGPSSWWREIDSEQPLLEIPTSSLQIAESVVRDYCNGLLAYSDVSRPGIDFIPGEIKITDLVTKYKGMLDKAKVRQNNWYTELVKIADSLWSRSSGNPLSVPDEARLAARELGLDTKEWLQNFQDQAVIRCVGCGSMRNPLYPICPTCNNVIDQDLYNKLNIKAIAK